MLIVDEEWFIETITKINEANIDWNQNNGKNLRTMIKVNHALLIGF